MKLSAQAAVDPHTLQCELADEVLRSSGDLHLHVTGCSMLPTVWPGDTLVIQPAKGKVFEGDIILFSCGRRFVAHRVVAINDGCAGWGVRTQGDAVPYPDSPLAVSEVLGKVSFIRRNGKCIEPVRQLRFCERTVAAVFRHSSFSARVVVGARGMLQKLYGPSSVLTSRVPASRVQTASI